MPVTPLELTTCHLIGGRLEVGRGQPLVVEDPSTGRPIAELNQADAEQVAAAVGAADQAFAEWSGRPATDRSAAIERLADALAARRRELIDVLVAEVGTPISLASTLQVDVPISHLRWYARAARTDRTRRLGVSDITPRSDGYIAYRPAGVVAALTGYNYPLLLAVSKIGAALAAGCTVVLIPSPLAPLNTLLLGQAALDAELPPGVLNVLCAGPHEAAALTRAERVAKISFTGSVSVGRSIMRQAADGLKGVVLELGGKSPNILLPDFDPAVIAEVHLRYLRNAGQGCAAPTRLLVPQARHAEFLESSRTFLERVPVGDPWDAETVVGPVITAEHRDRIEAIIEESARAGAHVIRGQAPTSERGYWVAPALIDGLPSSASAVQEEIFGPVAVVQTYETIEDAIKIANESKFGLAANIYSRDLLQAQDLAARLQVGLVTINGGGGLRPDGVFGGFKASGIGREHGELGIREFLEPQHVQWPVGTNGAIDKQWTP